MKTKNTTHNYTIQVKFKGEAWRDSWVPGATQIEGLKLARRWRIVNAKTKRVCGKVIVYKGLAW